MKGAIFTIGTKLPDPCDHATCYDGEGVNSCHFCEGSYCDKHFEPDQNMCYHCAGGDGDNKLGPWI